MNGWQAYGRFNQAPGVGLQILYKPTGSLTFLGNQYIGTDTLGIPDRLRIHTDDSAMSTTAPPTSRTSRAPTASRRLVATRAHPAPASRAGRRIS